MRAFHFVLVLLVTKRCEHFLQLSLRTVQDSAASCWRSLSNTLVATTIFKVLHIYFSLQEVEKQQQLRALTSSWHFRAIWRRLRTDLSEDKSFTRVFLRCTACLKKVTFPYIPCFINCNLQPMIRSQPQQPETASSPQFLMLFPAAPSPFPGSSSVRPLGSHSDLSKVSVPRLPEASAFISGTGPMEAEMK